jgi:hypothetical protein
MFGKKDLVHNHVECRKQQVLRLLSFVLLPTLSWFLLSVDKYVRSGKRILLLFIISNILRSDHTNRAIYFAYSKYLYCILYAIFAPFNCEPMEAATDTKGYKLPISVYHCWLLIRTKHFYHFVWKYIVSGTSEPSFVSLYCFSSVSWKYLDVGLCRSHH